MTIPRRWIRAPRSTDRVSWITPRRSRWKRRIVWRLKYSGMSWWRVQVTLVPIKSSCCAFVWLISDRTCYNDITSYTVPSSCATHARDGNRIERTQRERVSHNNFQVVWLLLCELITLRYVSAVWSSPRNETIRLMAERKLLSNNYSPAAVGPTEMRAS